MIINNILINIKSIREKRNLKQSYSKKSIFINKYNIHVYKY